jgi:hypothetical protein
MHCKAVFRIRTNCSYKKYSKHQCCGSGSGRIRIILWDLDPDRHSGHADPDPAEPDWYQFQENDNLIKNTVFQKISIWNRY